MKTIERVGVLQRTGLLLLLAFMTLALANCDTMGSTQPIPTPGSTSSSPTHTFYRINVVNNVSYGPGSDEKLDGCKPVGVETFRPGVILIHGGAWEGGDKAQYTQICQNLAHMGFVAITINYRLTSEGYRWPDQIGDAQLAVRWMRVHAAALDLDPTRICALGDSAGAHLALLLDELPSIHPADVAGLYSSVSPQVKCVVDQFGPTDLAKLYALGLPFVKSAITALMDGQTPTQNPTLYSDASPVDHINPLVGKLMIVQGTQDTTVLPGQSTELRQDLQKAGIPVRYISYTGGHEYRGSTLTTRDSIHQQIYSWLISVEKP